jgi:hypothetical protein
VRGKLEIASCVAWVSGGLKLVGATIVGRVIVFVVGMVEIVVVGPFEDDVVDGAMVVVGNCVVDG